VTSRKHLVRKHNKLNDSRLSRGINVPDSRLNPKELEARRVQEALRKRIEAKDKRIDISKKERVMAVKKKTVVKQKATGKKKPLRSDSVRKEKTAVKKVPYSVANINSRVILAEDKMRAYISRGKPANMTMAQYREKIATLERAWKKAKKEESEVFDRMWNAGYKAQKEGKKVSFNQKH
jgi:hypothetical protein